MSKLLIVGNGFDLNLGLKTSYKDFLESAQFNSLLSGVLIKSDNTLANYINNNKNKNDWVDVENLLKNFVREYNFGKNESKTKSIKKLNKEFELLKKSLIDYLISSSDKFNNKMKTTQAAQVVQYGYVNKNVSWHSENERFLGFNNIINFNYTDSLVFLSINKDRSTVKNLHGTLRNRDIVFGVEDGSVERDFAFLHKSDHAQFGKVNLASEFKKSDDIHFFGCAIGETDDTHFKPAFRLLADERRINTRLIFYVYGHDSYVNLRNNLLRHTEDKFGELKSNHEVYFYDLQTDKEIDQEWLNNLGGE